MSVIKTTATTITDAKKNCMRPDKPVPLTLKYPKAPNAIDAIIISIPYTSHPALVQRGKISITFGKMNLNMKANDEALSATMQMYPKVRNQPAINACVLPKLIYEYADSPPDT